MKHDPSQPETTDEPEPCDKCGWSVLAGGCPHEDAACPQFPEDAKRLQNHIAMRTADQNEWWIVFDTLREARKRLQSLGARQSWMDGAIDIAKERAGV